ncbi:hypothetical protein T439DRAFT_324153, partial [Meredithblackwellia eburnea MCA 4105]
MWPDGVFFILGLAGMWSRLNLSRMLQLPSQRMFSLSFYVDHIDIALYLSEKSPPFGNPPISSRGNRMCSLMIDPERTAWRIVGTESPKWYRSQENLSLRLLSHLPSSDFHPASTPKQSSASRRVLTHSSTS